MNTNIIKCLPVLMLALGLSACGKSETTKSSGGAPASIEAASFKTTVEADCGADVAAASAAANFDISQCQLTPDQKALVQDVGPLKVEADCVKQSVVIKSASEQVTGVGSINADGTFSVPLMGGERFGGSADCQTKLEGLATGKVACTEDKKVDHVDVNAAFTFAPVPAEGAVASLEFALLDEPAPAPVAPAANPAAPDVTPATIPGSGNGPGHGDPGREPGHDHDHRGDKGKGPIIVPAPANQAEKGKGPIIVPAPANQTEKGKGPIIVPAPANQAEKGKAPVVVAAPGNQAEKGKAPVVVVAPGNQAEKGKQGQQGQQGKVSGGGVYRPNVPGRHLDSCVMFSPCGFATNVTLQCRGH